MVKKKKVPSWGDVELILKNYDKEQLLGLLKDVYQVSSENKSFFHSRFSLGQEPLEPYQRIIQKALNPDPDNQESLDIEKADNAIKQYCKAVDNPRGESELRLFYVECGNDFTMSYGDVDKAFYNSMLEMYDYAIETILELPAKEQEAFKIRLKKVMNSASHIGWGYGDGLSTAYREAFPEDN